MALAKQVSPCDCRMWGHLPVTMIGEPDRIMFFRRLLTPLTMAGVLLCGAVAFAQTPAAPPKAAKSAAAKPTAAAKQEPVKPPAAATGGVEPTLIGQF